MTPSASKARASRDLVFVGCLVAVLAPFVAGLVRAPFVHWTPVGDWALLELRTRSVGGAHTPLLGVYSRFGWSHPGPALFYALAAPYRLFGGNPDGLLAAALLVNGAAVAGVQLLAWRRGGRALAVATAIAIALLCHSLGAEFLRDPWNPYVTLLPLVLLVFLAWSIACGDTWMVPIAALVASFIVQSHVGYTVLAVTPLLVAGVWRVVAVVRARPHRVALGRRRTIAIALTTFAVVLGAWLPPLLDQVSASGNLQSIWKFFTHPHSTPTADTTFRLVSRAVSLPGGWITGRDPISTSHFVPVASGLVLPVGLVALLIGGVLAARRRDGNAVALVVIVIAMLGAGVYSIAHIVGVLAAYLVRWLLALAMLCWLAAAWAAWPWLRRVARAETARNAIAVIVAVVLVVVVAAEIHDSARATAPWSRLGAVERGLARTTIAHYEGDGRPVLLLSDHEYWFTWGLAPRLEAAGIAVAARRKDVLYYGRHRVDRLPEADRTIVVVVGAHARTTGRPLGGRLLAFVAGRPLTGTSAKPHERFDQVVDLAERRLLTQNVAVYEVRLQ